MADTIRALVADDSRLNRTFLSHLLRENGYSVVLAHTGSEGVAEVQKQEFDVILMDLEMPDLCGLDATVAIRQLVGERYKRVTIVGMTAQSDSHFKNVCLACGMNAFIAKPIRPVELFDELQRLRGAAEIT